MPIFYNNEHVRDIKNTKLRIHQFTNLKCCNISFEAFEMKRHSSNPRIGQFVVSFFDVTNMLNSYYKKWAPISLKNINFYLYIVVALEGKNTGY